MRNKISVLSQKMSLGSTNTIMLPNNSIHDAYMLKFNITVKNDTASSITSTIEDILESITEIKVVTDAVREHYVLNGLDAAYATSVIHKSFANSVLQIQSATIAANGTKSYEFILVLDEGDIVAVAHTSVAMTVNFATTTGLGLTVTSAECTVTVKETIVSSAELTAQFGEELAGVVEPKVAAYTISAPACSEFAGVFDLPTNTLLKGAIIKFTGTGGVLPTQVGILRNTPDRVELGKEDWETRRALDEIVIGSKIPAGVICLDFGTQWQANGIGKDGWSFAKHDVELAIKAAAAQTIRYISRESLVNTTLWSKSGIDFTTY